MHLAAKLLQCCQNIQIDLRCNCWTLQVELRGMDPSKWSLVPNLITGCGRVTHAQTVKSEAKNTWACDLCSYNVDSWPRLCNKHSYCINQNVLISWQVLSAQWGSHSDWSYTVPHTTLSKPWEGMDFGVQFQVQVSSGFYWILSKVIKVIPFPHGAGTWWDQLWVRDSCSSRQRLSPPLPEDVEGAGWWLAPEPRHATAGWPGEWVPQDESGIVEINMDRIVKCWKLSRDPWTSLAWSSCCFWFRLTHFRMRDSAASTWRSKTCCSHCHANLLDLASNIKDSWESDGICTRGPEARMQMPEQSCSAHWDESCWPMPHRWFVMTFKHDVQAPKHQQRSVWLQRVTTQETHWNCPLVN